MLSIEKQLTRSWFWDEAPSFLDIGEPGTASSPGIACCRRLLRPVSSSWSADAVEAQGAASQPPCVVDPACCFPTTAPSSLSCPVVNFLQEEARTQKKKTAALKAELQETSEALLGLLEEVRK